MLRNIPLKYLWLDDPAAERALGEQDLLEKVFHFRTKPLSDRHSEAHFSTIHDIRRYQSGRDLFQKRLCLKSAKFEFLGKTRSELDHFMIKKWRARFQTICH